MKPEEYPEILFEDNHLLIINKRAGEISQGDKTGDKPVSESIKQYLKETYQKPGNVYLGLVHRLDRPVSGVLLFAKTSKAAARMSEQLRLRQIQKTYWAVVKKTSAEGTIKLVHYLKKNEKMNKSFAFLAEQKDAKLSILNYKVIYQLTNFTVLEVKPETGRHHQIRAQLAAIGSTIKGDLKYGFNRTNENGSIHLHARTIEFSHPVTKENIIISAKPDLTDTIWKTVYSALYPE